MPVSEELKELAGKFLPDLQITDDTTTADIEKAFGDNFISAKLHEEEKTTRYIAGIAKAENALAKVLGSDANGKKYDEMVEVLKAKMEEKEAKIAELAEATKTKSTKEDSEKYKAELEQLSNSLKEAQNQIALLSGEKEQALSEADRKLNEYKKTIAIESLYNSVNWADGVDLYKKEGIWNREVNGKVTFKEDADGEYYVYDANGEHFLKDGVGKMTAKKYFETIAEKADALKKNGAANTKVEVQNNGQPVNSKQLAHLELMKQVAAGTAVIKK